MTKKRRIGWLGWTALSVGTIFLLSSVLALISMLFPYVPSQRSQGFCHYVLPPIFFLILLGLVLIGNYRAHHDPGGKTKAYQGSWLKLILFVVLIPIAWGWMMVVVPAIPAKFFAQKKINFVVTVNRLDGLRLNDGYWTWIYFDQGSATNRFMWTRSDPLLSTLKHGDCIMLYAREWSLGMYVDSISRSTACKV